MFPTSPLLLAVCDEATARLAAEESAQVPERPELRFWAQYRGETEQTLQLMLLPVGETEAAPRTFSRYNRRYKVKLEIKERSLVATLRNARGPHGGWNSWTVALVTRWAKQASLPEVDAVHFEGLSSTMRREMFDGKGDLRSILKLASVVPIPEPA